MGFVVQYFYREAKCVKRVLQVISTFIIAAVLCVLPVFGADGMSISGNPRVLFLSSYSYEWESNPSQLEGIADVMKNHADMEYVFMDTKRKTYEDVKEGIYSDIAERQKIRKYDYVIVADDAALEFVIEYRDDLFAGIPIIFDGINDEEFAYEAAKDPLMTGIVETFPLDDTIELATKLNPDASKVVAVTDDTVSGKGSTKQFLDSERNFPDLEFSTIDCSVLSYKEVGDEVAALSDDTILIFLMMTKDADGNNFSPGEAAQYLSSKASIPIYKSDELGLGEGYFGGVMISYYDMASDAASMVLELEDGADVSDYHVRKAKSNCEFDINMMKKFGVTKKDVQSAYSGEIIFINDEQDFFRTYWKIIVPELGVILLLLIFISYYVVSSRKEKKLMKEMEKRREKTAAAEREAIEAKAADMAKSDFLSNMSHDIRTPISTIMGLTDLALDETDKPDAIMNDLNEIHSSSEYLLTIINDILDMSRIEKGKFTLDKEWVRADDLVQSCVEIIKPSMDVKDICFEYPDYSKIPNAECYIDPVKTKRMLINILNNACKFTSPGGKIILSINNLRHDDKTTTDQITIEDNGCGMSREFMEKIFTPFAQEQNNMSSVYQGTGLGLALAKRTADEMGGNIDVESELGVGTKFIITLPYEYRLVSDADRSSRDTDVAIIEKIRGRHILICEDNEVNIKIERRIIENVGCVVESVTDGEKGVEAFRASPEGSIDLILMDIRMPVMDGIEAARAIRSLKRSDAGTVPIIAMSANAFTEDVEKSKRAGMNEHLSKPVNKDELYKVMSKYI